MTDVEAVCKTCDTFRLLLRDMSQHAQELTAELVRLSAALTEVELDRQRLVRDAEDAWLAADRAQDKIARILARRARNDWRGLSEFARGAREALMEISTDLHQHVVDLDEESSDPDTPDPNDRRDGGVQEL